MNVTNNEVVVKYVKLFFCSYGAMIKLNTVLQAPPTSHEILHELVRTSVRQGKTYFKGKLCEGHRQCYEPISRQTTDVKSSNTGRVHLSERWRWDDVVGTAVSGEM